MHEHDIDRIAAVAEHRLSGQELAAAKAEIDACGECSRRLEEQHTAISLLKQAPPVAMTSIERARLHRAIRQAPSRSRWMRLAPAFAAAAALVVVVASAILPRGAGTATLRLGQNTESLQGAADSADDAGSRAPEAFESTAAPATTTLPDQTLNQHKRLLAAQAEDLRSSVPGEATTTRCAVEARDRLNEDSITTSEVDYNGITAVMYVYPETALVFDRDTCDLLVEIPADTP
jgi:bacterioferritin-associated ferredoxin